MSFPGGQDDVCWAMSTEIQYYSLYWSVIEWHDTNACMYMHKQLFMNCLAKYHELVINIIVPVAATWIVIQISASYATIKQCWHILIGMK